MDTVSRGSTNGKDRGYSRPPVPDRLLKERSAHCRRLRARSPRLSCYLTGLYAMQSISTFMGGEAKAVTTVVRAGLACPKNSA